MVLFFFPLFFSTLLDFHFSSFFCFLDFSPFLFPQIHLPPYLRCFNCLFELSTPSHSTLADFHRSVIRANYWKPAEQCGHKRHAAFSLFLNVDENATRVRTFTLRVRANNAVDIPQRQVHDHFLSHDSCCALIAIPTAVVRETLKSQAYPYSIPVTVEMPCRLAGVTSASIYA